MHFPYWGSQNLGPGPKKTMFSTTMHDVKKYKKQKPFFHVCSTFCSMFREKLGWPISFSNRRWHQMVGGGGGQIESSWKRYFSSIVFQDSNRVFQESNRVFPESNKVILENRLLSSKVCAENEDENIFCLFFCNF